VVDGLADRARIFDGSRTHEGSVAGIRVFECIMVATQPDLDQNQLLYGGIFGVDDRFDLLREAYVLDVR
jgi:hypothetical protein